MTKIYEPWTYLPYEKRVVDNAGKNVAFISPHIHTPALAEVAELIERADRAGRLCAAAPELAAIARAIVDKYDFAGGYEPEIKALREALKKAEEL